MRNCISLALATTPSGLGSRCKHVGAPTRLRIGNWLRRKCSAVAGGEGARAKGAVSKGTICTFQCACKNAKPDIPQKWGCLLLGGVRGGPAGVSRDPCTGPAGCTAHLWRVPDRDRHAAWQVLVGHTGARAGDDITGG